MGTKGTFRRRVSVTTRTNDCGALEARCAMEDDFHHFRVLLEARDDRGPVGGCWAWQPQRIAQLRRLPENRRDFLSQCQGRPV